MPTPGWLNVWSQMRLSILPCCDASEKHCALRGEKSCLVQLRLRSHMRFPRAESTLPSPRDKREQLSRGKNQSSVSRGVAKHANRSAAFIRCWRAEALSGLRITPSASHPCPPCSTSLFHQWALLFVSSSSASAVDICGWKTQTCHEHDNVQQNTWGIFYCAATIWKSKLMPESNVMTSFAAT